MSILSDARQLLAERAYLHSRLGSTGTFGTIQERMRFNQIGDELIGAVPELLTYAEMREAQAIEEKAKSIKVYCKYDDMGLKCDISSKGGWCDSDARIKELEQQLEGQKAYISRLEASYLKAEFWNLWHTGKYDDVEKANKKAEGALEKLRKG